MADPVKQVPTNQSAKDRFQASQINIANHRQMMEQSSFEKGTDAALIQYVSEVSNDVRDQPSALAAGFRIAGAVGFLNTLKTISEKPALPAIRPSDNLHQI